MDDEWLSAGLDPRRARTRARAHVGRLLHHRARLHDRQRRVPVDPRRLRRRRRTPAAVDAQRLRDRVRGGPAHRRSDGRRVRPQTGVPPRQPRLPRGLGAVRSRASRRCAGRGPRGAGVGRRADRADRHGARAARSTRCRSARTCSASPRRWAASPPRSGRWSAECSRANSDGDGCSSSTCRSVPLRWWWAGACCAESRDPNASMRPDLLGASLAITSVGVATLAIVEAEAWGWRSIARDRCDRRRRRARGGLRAPVPTQPRPGARPVVAPAAVRVVGERRQPAVVDGLLRDVLHQRRLAPGRVGLLAAAQRVGVLPGPPGGDRRVDPADGAAAPVRPDPHGRGWRRDDRRRGPRVHARRPTVPSATSCCSCR